MQENTIQKRYQGKAEGFALNDVVDLSEEEKKDYKGCGLYHVVVKEGKIVEMTFIEEAPCDQAIEDFVESYARNQPNKEQYTAVGSCCQLMEFTQTS